jgi:hypothetical protein
MGRQKWLIVIITVAVVFIGLIIYGIFAVTTSKNTAPTPTPASAQYYDKQSGQTVSNPAGKGPDVYGSNPNTPVFLGFSDLTNVGLSYVQVEDIQQGFTNYSSLISKTSEVSIDVSTINDTFNNTGGNSTVSFSVTLNRVKQLLAKVNYSGLLIARLYLFDGTKQVFDSGDINFQTYND